MKRLIPLFFLAFISQLAMSQCPTSTCGGTMVPGYVNVGGNLEGCAPLPVSLQTLYDNATPGTEYIVDWGDGTVETYCQQPGDYDVRYNKFYAEINHTYTSLTNCDYVVTIRGTNVCNSASDAVTSFNVAVWTPDIVFTGPPMRICAGYQAAFTIYDLGLRNCYPRLNNPNDKPRWLDYTYGVGPAPGSMISGVTINGVSPSWPYSDPDPNRTPIYPVLTPGDPVNFSLPIEILPPPLSDVGKEFWIRQRVWNQCNPYDSDLSDGPRNPLNGNILDGDAIASEAIQKIIVVESPEARFQTRNSANLPATSFCIGEQINLFNLTFIDLDVTALYTWEFFDDAAVGNTTPILTRTLDHSSGGMTTFSYATSGKKLIRLHVRDINAVGVCETTYELIVQIQEPIIAKISALESISGTLALASYCVDAAGMDFDFYDITIGAAVGAQQWRWEFVDPAGIVFRSAPAAPGAFSATPLGPFFNVNLNKEGIYKIRLIIKDLVTGCTSTNIYPITIFKNPDPLFNAATVCFGNRTTIENVTAFTSTTGSVVTGYDWDINYDGTTFNAVASYHNIKTISPQFATAGYHTIALKVVTSQGCSSIKSAQVLVEPIPIASFLPQSTTGCGTLQIIFDNNSTVDAPGQFSRFVWEVDDGNGFFNPVLTQPVSSPTFVTQVPLTFVNTGASIRTFKVRLRAETSGGCSHVSAPVTITSFPNQPIGINNPFNPFDKNCSPLSVAFEADAYTQSLTPSDYAWTVTDAAGVVVTSTSTGNSPVFNYTFINNNVGQDDYTIALTITTASSCPSTAQTRVRVNPLPQNTFDIDTIAFTCDEVRLRFTPTETGHVDYRFTAKIDGTTVFSGSTTTYEATYLRKPTDQTLEVSLDAKNFAFCQNTPQSQSVVIPMTGTITAGFTATPASQTLPNSTVTVTNTSSSGAFQYEWDFGDGTTSSEENPAPHVYASFGVYLIGLKVSQGSCYAEHYETIVIDALPPVLEFEYDPASGCSPLTVKFTNLSENVDEATFEWDFGPDIARANTKNPSVLFETPGRYSVTLSATSLNGTPIAISKPLIIEVFEKPLAYFRIVPNLIYLPEGRAYMLNSSLGASSYEWDFGDGTTSTDVSPVHRYTEEGLYVIKLKASNVQGCTDEFIINPAATVRYGGDFKFPNAFTPAGGLNGGSSGTNDVFRPLTRGLTEYHLQVFNKWGQTLFETTDPDQGWDGTFNGAMCPSDVYVYKLVGKLRSGELVTRVGDINLIR